MDEHPRNLEGLETATVGSSPVEPAEIPVLAPGTRVGRFAVLSLLGMGGMGVVYKAHDPELDRHVALKLVNLHPQGDPESASQRNRLLREAQALAQLSHRNVVTVYEVGTFGQDVFLAMELVEGLTLRRWLAQKKRPWQEILAVMLEAGRGLAAAHRAGLVHRDFKPDNVMVGADGRVCVLDFGLARAARLDLTARSQDSASGSQDPSTHERLLSSSVTSQGIIVGTLSYMSPEQFLREPVDERTDQFAFCVALFEALHGARPYRGDTASALKRYVLQGKISWPRSGPEVPPWIDRILQRGLSVSPALRFPSLDALLGELEHDPEAERQRRGTARRRLLLGAALGAAGMAILGGALWQSQRPQPCQGAGVELAGVWNDAARERVRQAFAATGLPMAADSAARVSRILDRYADGWVGMQREACAATRLRAEQSEQMLDLRRGCLTARRDALGQLVALLARPDRELVARSLEIAYGLPPLAGCADLQALGAFSARVAAPPDAGSREKVHGIRERLARSKVLEDAGKPRDALSIASQAVIAATEVGYVPVMAEARLARGRILESLSDYKPAAEELLSAWGQAELCNHHEVKALAGAQLVWLVGFREARFEEGLRLARLTEYALGHLGRDSEPWLLYHKFLGVTYWYHGDHQTALDHHQRSLAVGEKLYGKDHPNIAKILNNIAGAYVEMGEPEKARPVAERDLDLARKAFGEEHPFVALTLNNLGTILESLDELPQAIALYERAVGIARRCLGEEHNDVALYLFSVGSGTLRSGAPARAKEPLQQARAIWEKLHGPRHPYVADSLEQLGNVELALGLPDPAERFFREAIATREAVLGATHPALASALVGLAEVESQRGAQVRALATLERALSLCQTEQGCGPETQPLVRFHLARVLARLGREPARALSLALDARVLLRKQKHAGKPLGELEGWLRLRGH